MADHKLLIYTVVGYFHAPKAQKNLGVFFAPKARFKKKCLASVPQELASVYRKIRGWLVWQLATVYGEPAATLELIDFTGHLMC